MATIKVSMVDALVDAIDEDADEGTTATALADLLDRHGEWDWCDDDAHDPYDRLAVVEGSGAAWCVYRGSEADSADRYASSDDAWARLADIRQQIKGGEVAS